ncbi:MAG TPA: hypothetical protein VK974_11380 [Methylophilaceae bacterium]|nr:hypothetical protein [Methylophilaceae bacterium]
MSLLIKALEKAEKGKAADGSGELMLEPMTKAAGAAPSNNDKQVNQQAAATVFAAKNEQKPPPPSNKALLVGGAILMILAVAGLQFYAYLNGLSKPEAVMPRRSVVQVAAKPAAQPEVAAPVVDANASQSSATDTASTSNSTVLAVASEQKPGQALANQAPANSEPNLQQSTEPLAKTNTSSQVFAGQSSSDRAPVNQALGNLANPRQTVMATKSQQLKFGEPVQMSRDTSVQVTRNQAASGINPNLLAGYQAFNAGDDAAAQRNYRQVLQSDVRNVDALLGMAAIAARQGRNNDAAGWYGKVLEVEPRNNVAQSAMVNVLSQADPVSSESRIKNLIAQQPEAAHLYASLGNLYAEQNQWPSAQQAYFQAYHFDQNNAEYAFNLAVSLEQIGKSGLALPYYQRALLLLPANSASNIDRAQLETRIAKLQ